jgi:serine protease inhibitor
MRIALVAAVIFALFHGISAPFAAEPLSRERVIGAQTRLSERLATALERDPKRKASENVIVSPASLAGIMALLDIGADTKMRGAIFDTLGFTPALGHEPGPDLEGFRATISKAASDNREGAAKFTIANSIVFDPKSPPYEKAIAKIQATGAEVSVDSLSDPATIRRINDWVSKKTNGLIPSILEGPLPPGIVGLNALYFDGKWTVPFAKQATQPQPFHMGGSDIEVQMMHTNHAIAFRKGGRFVAVDLPYKDERFALTVITTNDRAAKLSEFAEAAPWLKGEGFEQKTVDLSLPRFKLESSESLLNAARAIGLSKGMDSATAFEGLSPVPQEVADILQKTYLRVDEEGTEAAAATAIITRATSMRPPVEPEKVVIDKPFLFALRDNDTGLILMSGYIARPNAITTADLGNSKQ